MNKIIKFFAVLVVVLVVGLFITKSEDIIIIYSTNDTAFIHFIEQSTLPTVPTNGIILYVKNLSATYSVFEYVDITGRRRMLDPPIVVMNVRGTTILKNRFVYVTGNNSGVPTVDYAKADSMSTMPAIGITIEDIANGSFGRVMHTGLLTNVNTAVGAFLDGDPIYVSSSTAGAGQNTPPAFPNLIQQMGIVNVRNATIGQVQVVTGDLQGNEHGTIQNTYSIGDGVAGTKTLCFNGLIDTCINGNEGILNLPTNTSMNTTPSCITMKSPDNTSYKFTIANGGTVYISAGVCS